MVNGVYPNVVEEIDTGSTEHESCKGDQVRLHGLISAEGCRFNGRRGTIVNYVPATGRYGIRIVGAEALKYIKIENVLFLGFEDDYIEQ